MRTAACLLLLAAAPAGALPPVAVSLDSSARGVSRLEGAFTTSAPRARAWEVLTDYEGLARFVSSLRACRVRERREGGVVLEQEAVAGPLFFKRSVRLLLEVRERRNELLAFVDAAKQDFELYEGSWELSDGEGGTLVTYRLRARGGPTAPGLVKRAVSRRAVAELLAQVREEMERRAP